MKRQKGLIWKPILEIPPTFWLEDFKYSEGLLTLYVQDQPEYEYKWSLFMVENSHYVEWFQEQSVGIHEDRNIAHYLIRTPNEIFEVLDLNEPRPTLIWN